MTRHCRIIEHGKFQFVEIIITTSVAYERRYFNAQNK